MSAFELSRQAAARHDRAAGTDGGPDSITQAGEFIIRESRTEWISTADWVEVEQ